MLCQDEMRDPIIEFISSGKCALFGEDAPELDLHYDELDDILLRCKGKQGCLNELARMNQSDQPTFQVDKHTLYFEYDIISSITF